MAINYLTLNEESGSIEYAELTSEIAARLQCLKENHPLYFDLSQKHELVAIGSLVNKRVRPDGIISANSLMRAAASGEFVKRKPISIQPLDNGFWLILDGNSTFMNGMRSGWETIPCCIDE